MQDVSLMSRVIFLILSGVDVAFFDVNLICRMQSVLDVSFVLFHRMR